MTKETLLIRQVAHNSFEINCAGVTYKPTNDTTHVGALIFALRPTAVVTDDKRCSRTFAVMAAYAVACLKGHVNGRTLPDDVLERWAWGAIDLAPNAAAAADVRWRIEHALVLPRYALNY